MLAGSPAGAAELERAGQDELTALLRRCPRPFGSLIAKRFGDQERELQRLCGIQPRIAVRMVSLGETFIGDCCRTPDALGYVLARHFDMDPAGMGSFGAMDGEEGLHLGENALERARLVAAGAFDEIPVHRVA